MSRSAHFAIVHHQVEHKLERRVPSALSPRGQTVRERMVSGEAVLDALLDPGLPVGAITEMAGASGSGRTTAATAFLAATTRAGKVAAWVDVADAFDPTGAALNGVHLERLLWVRCAVASQREAVPALEIKAGPATQPADPPMAVRGGGSPHPRTEIHGMPEAIRKMLAEHGGLQHHQARRERKKIGTPGMPNRPLGASPYREEQVPTDRAPSRLAAHHRSEQQQTAQQQAAIVAPRCAEPLPHRRKTENWQPPARSTASIMAPRQEPHGAQRCSWTALDRALRATDLLLQAGGFELLVLDLGDTPAEMAWRIPMTTWFRYRAGCERSRTSLLVLTQHPCAQSSAELVVRFEPGEMEAGGKAMTGFAFRAHIERQRFAAQPSNVVPIRKPPQSERPGQWKGRASWAV